MIRSPLGSQSMPCPSSIFTSICVGTSAKLLMNLLRLPDGVNPLLPMNAPKPKPIGMCGRFAAAVDGNPMIVGVLPSGGNIHAVLETVGFLNPVIRHFPPP